MVADQWLHHMKIVIHCQFVYDPGALLISPELMGVQLSKAGSRKLFSPVSSISGWINKTRLLSQTFQRESSSLKRFINFKTEPSIQLCRPSYRSVAERQEHIIILGLSITISFTKTGIRKEYKSFQKETENHKESREH